MHWTGLMCSFLEGNQTALQTPQMKGGCRVYCIYLILSEVLFDSKAKLFFFFCLPSRVWDGMYLDWLYICRYSRAPVTRFCDFPHLRSVLVLSWQTPHRDKQCIEIIHAVRGSVCMRAHKTSVTFIVGFHIGRASKLKWRVGTLLRNCSAIEQG